MCINHAPSHVLCEIGDYEMAVSDDIRPALQSLSEVHENAGTEYVHESEGYCMSNGSVWMMFASATLQRS